MRENKGNGENSFDQHEDIVRLEKLDDYEAIIKYNLLDENNNKSVK